MERLRLLELRVAQMERPRLWNARSAILYCLLAGDIISVLIHPLAPGTRAAQMERRRLWNCAQRHTLL